MPLITNNLQYESVTETVTKPVVAHRAVLDLLNGCEYSCKGCFVQKNNSYTDQDLSDILELMLDVNNHGMLFDELVLGPVDIFGSSNGYDIITHPTFVEIMNRCKPILAMPTTGKVSTETLEKFIKAFNELYSSYTELEFQIVIDPKLIAARDIVYIEQLKRTIRTLDQLTPRVCYAMQMNVRSLKGIDLQDISTFIRDQFYTIIDIVPSYFRSDNQQLIIKMNTHWKDELDRQVNEQNKNDIQMVIADHSHDGHTYFNWYFKNSTLYISPFIYENAAVTHPDFAVPRLNGKYTAETITKFAFEKRIAQYEQAQQTDECATCEYLHSCIGHHIVQFMNINQHKGCILPKRVLQLYGFSINPLAGQGGIYSWDDYTTFNEIQYGNRRHHEFAEGKGLLHHVDEFWKQ